MFVWDESKRQSNIEKHGFDFVDFDPTVTVEDTRESYGEPRFAVLGLLRGVVVSGVYAERGDSIRVISLRKALKHEARFFLSQVGK